MPHKPPLSSAPSSSSSKLPALLFLKLFIPRGLMPYEAFSPCESLCQAADASCTNSDRPSSPLKDRPCVFIRNSERNMLYPVVRFALSCAQVGLCLWLGFLWLGCLFLQDWAAPLQKLVTCLAAKVQFWLLLTPVGELSKSALNKCRCWCNPCEHCSQECLNI